MLVQLPRFKTGVGVFTRGQHSLLSYGINFIQRFKTPFLVVRVDWELSVCLSVWELQMTGTGSGKQLHALISVLSGLTPTGGF